MSSDTMPCGCLGHLDNEDMCRYPALEKELAAERKKRENAEVEAQRLNRMLQVSLNDDAGIAARAEQVERERDEAKAQRDDAFAELSKANRETMAAVNRWERAEAVATEWAQKCHRMQSERDDERFARRRAEADNAAFVSELARVGEWAAKTRQRELEGAMRAILAQHHPGAALLERLRELEAQVGHDSPEDRALNEIAGLFGFGGPGPRSSLASHDELVEKVRALLEYVRALEVVRERLRDDVSAGHITLVDVCRELSDACRAVDIMKERKP